MFVTMKRGLLVFLAICAFTTAMVPRNRRAVNSEEEHDALLFTEESTPVTTTEKAAEPLLCAPQTPCGWSIYKPYTKSFEMYIRNTYCECSPGTECLRDFDDSTTSSIVHRCQPPHEKQDIIES